jgi:hypothetical protein
LLFYFFEVLEVFTFRSRRRCPFSTTRMNCASSVRRCGGAERCVVVQRGALRGSSRRQWRSALQHTSALHRPPATTALPSLAAAGRRRSDQTAPHTQAQARALGARPPAPTRLEPSRPPGPDPTEPDRWSSPPARREREGRER